MLAHVDPHARLRNIVSRAIDGCSYESSQTDESRMLVIEARRSNGARVHLRFRGVQDSEASEEPALGARMRLRGVSAPEKFSLLRLFLPRFPRPQFSGEARVRIEA